MGAGHIISISQLIFLLCFQEIKPEDRYRIGMITAFKLRIGDRELEIVRVACGFQFSDDFPVLHTKESAIDKIVRLICENDPHFPVARESARYIFQQQIAQTYKKVLNLMD